MSRTARWIVAAVVVLAAAVGGAWVARRTAETTSDDARTATDVATSTPVASAERTARKRAEPVDAAPETSASADDEKPTPALVRFLVQTTAGKPIAGAKFTVKPDGDVPEVELVTDESGTARMPTAIPARDLNVVKARGFVVEERLERTDDEVVVTLGPGVDVAGRVLDGPSGRPIVGASVNAFIGSQGPKLIAASTTDAAGAFLLADVPAEHGWTWLDVRAAGHVGAGFELDRDDPSPVVVRLDPAGRVRGVVRDAERRPVWDVQVIATPTQGVAGDTCSVTRTDVEGRFALDGLRFGGAHDVVARGGDFVAAARVTVTVSAPEAVVDLAPAPTPRTSLTVVVTSTDGPRHRVRLLLCRNGEKDVQPQTLDEMQTATFAGIAPGTIHVFAWADDRAVESVDLELADGDEKRIEIALERELVVVGTVVDDAGEPIAGADVGCRESIGGGCREERGARTDADGRFRFHVATTDVRSFDAGAKGHARGCVSLAAAGLETAPLRFVLSRETTALMRLRGQGVPSELGVIFDWLDEAGTTVDRERRWPDVDDRDLTIAAPVTARRLRVLVDGFLPVDRNIRPVFGETLDLGEIVLDAGASVVVRVVDSDGRDVVSPDVSVNTADAKAQPDGTFEARGIAPGPVVIEVDAPGFVPTKVAIDAAKSGPPVVVKLARGAYARVRVVDAHGRAAACDGVKAIASDGTETPLEAKMAGTFAARLPAGRFRFVATRGDVSVEATQPLVEGGTSDVTLQFAR